VTGTVLYHYTCDHGYEGILRDGWVRPNRHPMWPTPVAWFTDLLDPTPEQVGLTSQITHCNRLAHRFEVADGPALVPWLNSGVYASLPIGIIHALHFGDALPRRWWVALRPVPILTPTKEADDVNP
jgi:hypothetical protein